MLKISNATIISKIFHPMTYTKGVNYFNQGRVEDFEYIPETSNISASVLGSGYNHYDVNIHIDNNGEILNYTCSCEAFEKYTGMCKHIVATLKQAQLSLNSDNVINFIDSRPKSTSRIFSYFENISQQNTKKEINLEINYEFSKAWRVNSSSSISLRIGDDKLYVVKNLRDFLDALNSNEKIQYGKNFTFDNKIHTFNKVDRTILDLLLELYEYDKMASGASYNFSRSYIFNGKNVYLPSNSLRKLFSILKEKKFNASIYQYDCSNITITNDELPIEITLTKDKNDLILKLYEIDEIIPLTKNHDYFYCNHKIYEIPEDRRTYFSAIHEAFEDTKNTIRIPSHEKQRFVSEVLPLTQKAAMINIDKSIEANFVQADLFSEIYFDKIKNGISARIVFNYNDERFEAFGKNATDSAKIIIRDVEKERQIISIFENADFTVSKDIMTLYGDENIFEFVYNTLPTLNDFAKIYYSDEFKNITIKNKVSISGGVRLNEESELLEFSLQSDDIDIEELKYIFDSLHEKKKYHRLKNGAFIPLQSPELAKISELVDYLNISGKDLSKKVIELPKYQAMYIDNLLREANITHIERNGSFKKMVQNIKEPQDMDYSLPEELQHVLRDYQKTGFKWLKTLASYGLGGILADDMGLGKTLQTIAFILSEKGENSTPSLVVAPTSLVYNWEDEISKFAPSLKALVISGLPKDRQEQIQNINQADIVITSYPLIRRDIEFYKDLKFRYCFLDEAQQIKNPESQNAKSVKNIKAGSYFALTGTPIENSLTELWSIFDFLMPGYLLSHSRFINKYERPIIKAKNELVLKELGRHISPFILRRLKKDVLNELPEKIEGKMTAELTSEQKKLYFAYMQKVKSELAKEIKEKGFEKSQIKILAYLTRLRQLCCHPSLFIEDYKGGSGKLELLQEVLSDALDGGHRILLFSQFTSMLDIIKKHLDQVNIQYLYLDGSTKAEERGRLVKEFNNGQGSIFLISLKAGGTGLNLTGADMVIHFDPWWNPAVEDQATDRAYRIGQKNIVQVIKLVTQGTIEEKIFALQQKKKEMINSVIQPGETMLSKMSEDEILSLFN